jgi:hypothetical protein
VARAARHRFGDLNYRINIEFAETIDLCGGAAHTANQVVPAENVAKLMSADQLKLEMAKGKVASRSDALPRESRPPPPCAATAAAWRAPQSLGMQVFPHFKEGKIDWLPTYRYERDKLQVRIGARCGCGPMQPDPALRARSLKAERHVLVDWLSAVVSCIAIDRARHSEGSALGSATPVLAQPTAFPMLCVACCLQRDACCMLMLSVACWLLRHAMPFD